MKKLRIIILLLGVCLVNSLKANTTVDSADSEYTPFVQEGKTWWYTNPFIGSPRVDGEFGLTIGKAMTLNGKVYHPVILDYAAEYHYANGKCVDLDQNPKNETCDTIGYIREDDSQIYICFNNKQQLAYAPIQPLFTHNHCFELNDFEDILLYDFNIVDGEVYRYGSESSYYTIKKQKFCHERVRRKRI